MNRFVAGIGKDAGAYDKRLALPPCGWVRLPASDRAQDSNGILPLQRIAPVEELDWVEPSLAGQGLMDRGPRPAETFREDPDRKSQFIRPLMEQPGQLLVGGILEWLLGGQTNSLFFSRFWHPEAKRVYWTVPKTGTIDPADSGTRGSPDVPALTRASVFPTPST